MGHLSPSTPLHPMGSPGWGLTWVNMGGHFLWQKPPLCYRAEMVEKRHKSLSDACDAWGEVGKVGLLEWTTAFVGPPIFMTEAQVGIKVQ